MDGGGLLRPAPTLEMYNFMTIKAITTKLHDFCITWLPTLTFPWQPVFDRHVFQVLHFSVLINIISMFYGVICFFSLSLATIYQIRYNSAFLIPISVEYLFFNCRNPRWRTRSTMKTILLCISINVLYFQFVNILLLGIYELQSNNLDF